MLDEESQTECPRRGNRFVNPYAPDVRRKLSDLLLWGLGHYDEPTETNPVPGDFKYPLPQSALNPEQPTACWINHSTFLVAHEGVHFLTDPIWSTRCSPVNFCGPIRRHPAAIPLEKLPSLDYVLISHDHYDHLDSSTVKQLHRRQPHITWVVPQGLKKWFHRRGIERVVELAWWESAPLNPDITITAVPAQHFSGRTMIDANQRLWVGYVIQFPKKRLYFAGDTGYNTYDFRKIGKNWNGMDLSLIPIGSYKPRKFMSPVHIEPHDAVEIHQEVGSKLSFGMHWKTFHLSDEEWNRPPYDLYLAMQAKGLDPLTFLAADPGHVINW